MKGCGMSTSRQDNNRPGRDGDALQRQEQDRRALALLSTRFPVTVFAASGSRNPELCQRRSRAYAGIDHHPSERLPVQPSSHGIATPHARECPYFEI